MDNIEKYAYPELKVKDQDWRWCHRYAHDVVTGKIVAGKWIKLACERHLNDLERDDVFFDEKKAASVVLWFKIIPLTDSSKFEPTVLLPWQIFFVCMSIAWLREDTVNDDEGRVIQRLGTFTYRRFDRAFVLIGRKNGKTTLIAGLMLYIMYKSPFMRPRAYSLATKMDQAKEVWSCANSMIRLSPELSSVFKARTNDILMPSRNGSFVPLPNDSKSLDGKNPLVASLDECHAVKDSNLYGVIGSAFGAQEEGFFAVITTAGFVLDGICTTLTANGKKCLDNENFPDVHQDNYLYLLYQIDNEKESGIKDRWDDEECWIKANAGIGFQPTLRYLKNQCLEAKMSATEKANFLTKHCNVFVSGAEKWLNIDEVKACRLETMDIEKYKGKPCWVGFDRSLVSDITSFCFLFPNDEGGADCFYINILPRQAILDATDHLKQVYLKAEANGNLEIMEGAIIRNSQLVKYFTWANENFNVQMFGYDPYKMTETAMEMEEKGLPMVAVSQGVGNMSEPTKKLESIIKDKTFTYNDDLLEFSCMNAIMGVTKMNNVTVYRENPQTEKIDPLIATIIALSCATLQKIDVNIYESHGLA